MSAKNSLDEVVSADHVVRGIDAVLDLGWIGSQWPSHSTVLGTHTWVRLPNPR
jgi:hypothetical protein